MASDPDPRDHTIPAAREQLSEIAERIRNDYDLQCAKEVLRMIAKEAPALAQMFRDRFEDEPVLSLHLISEAAEGLPINLAVGDPGAVKGALLFCDFFRKGFSAKLYKVFYDAKELFSDSEYGVAVFVRTRDVGNIVIHELVVGESNDAGGRIRAVVPYSKANLDTVLTIQRRMDFCTGLARMITF